MMSGAKSRLLRRVLAVAPVLVAGVVGLGFVWQLDRAGVARGFPLDDSWIHLRFASNLATGGGFGCNVGEPTPGATSPLWVVVLALAAKLGCGLEAAALYLGMILNAGACAALMLLTKRLVANDADALGGEDVAFWLAIGVGIFFGLTPCAVWSCASGLEIPLFMLLSFTGLVLHEDARSRGGWRWPASALVFGLASQARPEGYLLFALAGLEKLAWEWGRRDAPLRQRVLRLVGYGLAGAAVVLPYVLFCLDTTGRPLPNTYYAKSMGERDVWSLHYFKLLARLVGQEYFVLALFAPVGLVAHLARKRTSLLPVLWLLGLPLGYTLMPRNVFTLTAGNFGRYFYPVVPLVGMFGVFGLAVAVAAAGRRAPRGAVAIAGLLCALCVADAVGQVQRRRELFVTNVRNINELDVEMAKWVRDNTPPQARLMVCDVGAIPYFSGRHCTDTVGLVTPQLLPYLEQRSVAGEPFAETPLASFIEDIRPDYLIIFPDWYPKIVTALDKLPLAQRVKEFRIEDNVTCGGDTMVAYRFEWPKQGAD